MVAGTLCPRPRTMNRCWSPRTNRSERKRGSALPQTKARGGPASQGPEPATHTTKQATAAPGTDRGQRQRDPRSVNVHMLKAKTRLRISAAACATPSDEGICCARGGTRIAFQPLQNTGKSRKHTQSEPVRPTYDPVRGQECGQCPHLPFLPHSSTQNVAATTPQRRKRHEPATRLPNGDGPAL